MQTDRPKHLLFLSHSGSDTAAAIELKRKIEQSETAQNAGLKVWLDKDDLEEGKGWQAQLETVIESHSTAFAVYLGSKGVVNWVQQEVRLALSRAVKDESYPFIPLITQDARSAMLPPFARQYHGIRNIDTDDDSIRRLINAAIRANRQEPVSLLEEGESPFVGLNAFDISHSHLFFGRNDEREAIGEMLQKADLVAVTGDSGSGKSSLVKAGVIPDFLGGTYDGNEKTKEVIQTRPGKDAFEQLAGVLAQYSQERGHNNFFEIKDRIRSKDPQKIYDVFDSVFEINTQLLLSIDQFEELFTLCTPEIRNSFIELLQYLSKNQGTLSIKIIYTMRRDYYNLVSAFDTFKSLSEENHLFLRRMSNKGIEDAIIEPLKLTRYDENAIRNFASHVMQQVGDNAGDLTLIQIALTRTWELRNNYSDDLIRAFNAVGGITGALAQLADKTLGSVISSQSLDIEQFRHIFLRLIASGNTGGFTRRLADREEFSDEQWRIVTLLASRLNAAGEVDIHNDGSLGRIVVISGEDGKKNETVELIHEALITQWDTYQIWIQEAIEKDVLTIFGKITLKTKEWMRKRNQSKFLLSGAELDDAKRLRRTDSKVLSGHETTYIQKSENSKIVKQTLAALATFLIIIFAFGTIVGIEKDKVRIIKEQQLNVANHYLGLFYHEKASNYLTKNDRARSRLYNLSAQKLVKPEDFLATNKIVLQLNSNPLLQSFRAPYLMQSDMPYSIHSSVAFSPDGSKIISGSEDNTIRIWDAQTGEALQKLKGHTDPVSSVAFSPDGSKIISGSGDNTIRIWNAQTGEALKELVGHSGSVTSVAFSPDGSKIISSSWDNTIRIWDAQTGEALKELVGHSDGVTSVAFSPDGSKIISGSRDKTIRIWNAKTGESLKELVGHSDAVSSVAFNPDGSKIISGSWDGTIRIWNAQTGEALKELVGHTDAVISVAISPDGSKIISGSRDNTIRIWDAFCEFDSNTPSSYITKEIEKVELLLQQELKGIHLVDKPLNLYGVPAYGPY